MRMRAILQVSRRRVAGSHATGMHTVLCRPPVIDRKVGRCPSEKYPPRESDWFLVGTCRSPLLSVVGSMCTKSTPAFNGLYSNNFCSFQRSQGDSRVYHWQPKVPISRRLIRSSDLENLAVFKRFARYLEAQWQATC